MLLLITRTQAEESLRHSWANSALLYRGCMTFCKLHNFSEPHFLYLSSEVISLLPQTHKVVGSTWAKVGVRAL